MPSPIIDTTIQASILSATSSIIGQLITAYKNDASFIIDFTQVIQFVAFAIINSPLNFLWQTYLEQTFPATHLVPTRAALQAASKNNEAELDREEKTRTLLEPKLSVPNTLIKLLLDQTFGATFNTIIFSFVFAGFKGATFEQAVQITRQDFWGLVIAGWKLWPLVSVVNFAFLKSVQSRQLVNGLAGIGWGVYLSLITGSG